MFEFVRIIEGYNVGSLKGMMRKIRRRKIYKLGLKNEVEIYIYKDNKPIAFRDWELIVDDILEKLNDSEMKLLLTKIKDKHIQPCLLKTFLRSRDKMVNENLIRIK